MLDGCVLWGARVVVPPPGRERVIRELCEVHPGIARMKSLARSCVLWASLDADLEAKVRTCQPSRPSELVSCPDPLARARGSGVLSDFSCRVAPRSESLNQILERIIICAWRKRSYFEPNWR